MCVNTGMCTNETKDRSTETPLPQWAVFAIKVLAKRKNHSRVLQVVEALYQEAQAGRAVTVRSLAKATGYPFCAVACCLRTAEDEGILRTATVRDGSGKGMVLGKAYTLTFSDLKQDLAAVTAALKAPRTAERKEWQKLSTAVRKAKGTCRGGRKKKIANAAGC